MTKYNAQALEEQFKTAASMRIRKKERGNKKYANDAGYWEGGRCNWGGSHNLKEDCRTIAQGFSKINDLKNTKKELESCTSKQEYDVTKSRLIRQAQEIENSLQARTGASSSMFGICIIWADYAEFLDSKLRPLRNEVKRLKEGISKTDYKYIKELKLLKLEQKQIEARMKENKQKAANEKDSTKKAILLQLIEDDGQKLKENLEKQKAIPASNLRFEPDKYVSDLIEAMKKAIENNRHLRMPPAGHKKNSNNNNETISDNDSNSESSSDDESSSRKTKERKETSSNWWQENQQLIIISGIALLVIFYLYSQPEEPQTNSHG